MSKTDKVRSASGHPVNKVIKKPVLADIRPKAPMEKTIPGLLFPLAERPEQSYKEGARAFASIRNHGKRRHAGIDLYAPVGTPVRAMADGVVIQFYEFYSDTFVIEVDHGTFIARYGEVSKESILIKRREKITRGQSLAKVGKLTGLDISMLHLEMYGTTDNPVLKDMGLSQKKAPPFQRRSDLIDPTSSIDLAAME